MYSAFVHKAAAWGADGHWHVFYALLYFLCNAIIISPTDPDFFIARSAGGGFLMSAFYYGASLIILK